MLNNPIYARFLLKLERGAVLEFPERSLKHMETDPIGVVFQKTSDPKSNLFVMHRRLFHDLCNGRAVIRH